jgi:hypothetical protein
VVTVLCFPSSVCKIQFFKNYVFYTAMGKKGVGTTVTIDCHLRYSFTDTGPIAETLIERASWEVREMHVGAGTWWW